MEHRIEWLTLSLMFGAYLLWAVLLWAGIGWWAVVPLGILIAFQSSLQHEALHGHPFASARLNTALAFVSLIVVVPYTRFRDTHLAHHNDAQLTDPYDDPETNFLDPDVWARLPCIAQGLLVINNTLIGRLSVGPLIGTAMFLHGEWQQRTPDIVWQWAVHLIAVAIVAGAVWISPTAGWQYVVAIYIGTAILKLRTFLEHQAAARASARSVIVERGGGFGFLFLNNNLHVVHHMHPKVPWYALPRLYADNRAHYQRRNGGYVYRSYWAVMRAYGVRCKDPVCHPLWPRGE
ncbi:MAG: fatty acid desaturase [Yoonia sp.]|nr:fatty acid desaturase [Yoonia sp.]